MNRVASILVPLRAALIGCAIVIGIWVQLPWMSIAAIGVVSLILSAAELPVLARRKRVGKYALAAAWTCTLIAPGSLLLARAGAYFWDSYYAVLAWLVAASILPVIGRVVDDSFQTKRKILAMTWLFIGGFIWLAAAYDQNLAGRFYFGLAINFTFLILCRFWFRMGALGAQVVNTLILVLPGLPIADVLITTPSRQRVPREVHDAYSYETAKHDPKEFFRWWSRYLQEWNRMAQHIFIPDASGIFPFLLRPVSEGYLFQSRISINRLGFRGAEIPEEKGDTYRIVALGESTTFGCTLNPEDRPWPELLEKMIKERLTLSRPVEVINAGVPAYNLKHNVRRLQEEILALKPDMIISYHGYNGFKLLKNTLPRPRDDLRPAYKQRPLDLLAQFEYRLKMICYKQHQTWQLLHQPPSFSGPMQTGYARAYQQLADIAQTNGIQLVLANFSMAVNSRSEPEIVEFYRAGFPWVRWEINANTVHSMIVKQVAHQHPEVCLVDTHPHLDGHEEEFIDLVHFTQEGRQQLAETFFAAIKDILKTSLAPGDSALAGQGR